jgi:ATP-dependent DNA helicase RecG
LRPQKNRYLKQVQPVSRPLSTLQGIGPKRAGLFARKGIHTLLDLFFLTPLRYEDRTSVRSIRETQEGVISLIRGRVVQGGEQRLFPGKTRIFKILLRDASGEMELLWFHYRKPHLMRFTSPGTELFVCGMVRTKPGTSPDHPPGDLDLGRQ